MGQVEIVQIEKTAKPSAKPVVEMREMAPVAPPPVIRRVIKDIRVSEFGALVRLFRVEENGVAHVELALVSQEMSAGQAREVVSASLPVMGLDFAAIVAAGEEGQGLQSAYDQRRGGVDGARLGVKINPRAIARLQAEVRHKEQEQGQVAQLQELLRQKDAQLQSMIGRVQELQRQAKAPTPVQTRGEPEVRVEDVLALIEQVTRETLEALA